MPWAEAKRRVLRAYRRADAITVLATAAVGLTQSEIANTALRRIIVTALTSDIAVSRFEYIYLRFRLLPPAKRLRRHRVKLIPTQCSGGK